MMLAKAIKALSGLDTEDDSEEEQRNQGQSNSTLSPSRSNSRRRLNSSSATDLAHLAASPNGDGNAAAAPLATGTSPSPAAPAAPAAQQPRWTNFLDGAKKLMDAIIDMGEEPSDDEREQQQQRSGPGSSMRRAESEQHLDESEDPSLLQPTVPPTPLVAPPNQPCPQLSEPSCLLEHHHLKALIAELPLRHRQATWNLAYSTQRDGISLQTLLRRAKGRSPTVLVVRDLGKAVFGAFCSEPWRVSPRYFGTGETFVFSTCPRGAVWHWWWRKMAIQQNDFFMWATAEGIAVGGAGGYALWLDAELSRGISRTSATFGNECLASQEEFKVGAVECWWLD